MCGKRSSLQSENQCSLDGSTLCMVEKSRKAPFFKPRLPLARFPKIDYIPTSQEKFFICEASRQLIKFILSLTNNLRPCEKIVIGLSGGSTPRKIFSALSCLCSLSDENQAVLNTNTTYNTWNEHQDYDQTNHSSCMVDWSRVILFLVDERYVPPDHPCSNQKMICDTLVCNEHMNVPKENLIFPNTLLPLEECIKDYDNRLKHIISIYGNPHLVTLGLGEDGHLASWFPPLTMADVEQAYKKDCFVSHTTQDRFDVRDRITISLHLICSASTKMFFLYGENKVEKWNMLIQNTSKNSDESISSTILQEEPLLQVLQSSGVLVISCPPILPHSLPLHEEEDTPTHLSVVVFGASGDLATRKTLPALFSLFCDGYLPENFNIVGFARSQLSLDELWKKLEPYLLHIDSFFRGALRYQEAALRNPCFGFLNFFRSRLHYISGQYNNSKDFQTLEKYLTALECGQDARSVVYSNNKRLQTPQQNTLLKGNRLFYLALPSHSFADVISLTQAECWTKTGWNRVVIEKPFGRDLPSATLLAQDLLRSLTEEETYRIDHYLGKEMVQNLFVLRFANPIFAPLMSWHCVSAVRITFKETMGVEKRGGYFDSYGIIRDILQNHLLQLLTIIAMEPPSSMKDSDVRDEKVKVLRRISPLELKNLVVGQYTASADGSIISYRDDSTVPPNSVCPTFCTAVLYINNERWDGVPFILKAGKALEKRLAEIRIQLRPVAGNIFGTQCPPNEIVIQVQPSERVYLRVLTKKPGLDTSLEPIELDFTLTNNLGLERIPDAYERLILDVINGDQQNFVRTDELLESWRILTPCLQELDEKKVIPIPYPAGSKGPPEAYELIRQSGYRWVGEYEN